MQSDQVKREKFVHSYLANLPGWKDDEDMDLATVFSSMSMTFLCVFPSLKSFVVWFYFLRYLMRYKTTLKNIQQQPHARAGDLAGPSHPLRVGDGRHAGLEDRLPSLL